VNVDELQLHLTDLANLLRNAKARQPADTLDELCRALQPYRDRRLKDVFDLMAKAEEVIRSGRPPARARSTRQKLDAAAIEALGNRVVNLYQHATEAGSTRELIEVTFAELNQAGLSAAQLQTIAKRMGIVQKLTKDKLLDAMRRAVLDQKGAFERAQM
jgi:hypothetical protein